MQIRYNQIAQFEVRYRYGAYRTSLRLKKNDK